MYVYTVTKLIKTKGTYLHYTQSFNLTGGGGGGNHLMLYKTPHPTPNLLPLLLLLLLKVLPQVLLSTSLLLRITGN